mgnify:CR=1 FL=1
MLKLSNASFLISALIAGAAFTQTATATMVIDQPLAREASEGHRGEGGKKGGHPAIELKDQLARRGADNRAGDDRGGRGRGGRGGEGAGHPAIEVIEQLT